MCYQSANKYLFYTPTPTPLPKGEYVGIYLLIDQVLSKISICKL